MLLYIYLISTGLSLVGAIRAQNDPRTKDTPRVVYWSISFVPIVNTFFALAAIKDLITKG